MKWFVIFLLLSFFTSHAFCQRVVRKGVKPLEVKKAKAVFYNTGQLQGKWQEVLRTNPGSPIAINFNDTLLLNFNKNKVEVRDGISMNMQGIAAIDPPNTLHAAGDVYTIRTISGNTMLLDDGEFVHRMQRIPRFYYEILGKDSIVAEKYITPVPVDIKDLPGKWIVYRRQAGPGKVSDENLIKSIQVYPFNAGDSIKGDVVIYNADITLSLPASFHFSNGQMKIVTDRLSWDFNTYKANGKELIFGNEHLVYFTKPL